MTLDLSLSFYPKKMANTHNNLKTIFGSFHISTALSFNPKSIMFQFDINRWQRSNFLCKPKMMIRNIKMHFYALIVISFVLSGGICEQNPKKKYKQTSIKDPERHICLFAEIT